MTLPRLTDIEQRAQKATDGPWTVDPPTPRPTRPTDTYDVLNADMNPAHTNLTHEEATRIANELNGQPQYDDEGFLLDSNGIAWGHCNACGEETRADHNCCEDGEIVPE